MKKAVIFILLIFCVNFETEALKIADFYKEAKVGQWILMKSSDGLLTRTSVIAKGGGKVTLKIQNFENQKVVSDSEQVVNVEEGRVIFIRIYDQGNIKEIYPEKTEVDDFFQIEFRPIGQERVKTDKGSFLCDRYKGLYQDHVVHAWINRNVPILHLIKMRTQGASVRLVDYGSETP